ncbi:5,10-methylenetetrahydromethanopterin reductase [Halobacterium litoreum]|uniref:5,10-methylenetetrahydromethanopterin reductase n=1 Tax=Halobacterium litoreum TaxID=2039234 RepID=A0ABD5NGS5_9EURY|nr:5,10-methylenetetrahydromethanopterin reductase [Halobacterium litoreum]UHH13061.1 5,10-methylenetetrahydromethanopterin reductase [Halobacterium litoreum]
MRGIELTPEIPVSEVAELGALAEDAGFDSVFASCHYNNRDPFVALDRVAAATESVRVGPGVANPYETHPVKLASQVATLDEASGGRAVFGVGAGDASTLSNLGFEREKPLRRVLEAFKVAQDLWDGERVDHDGTFVARDAGLNYDAGEIPVYVGAQGPHMLRMAGKHADGVLVNASHPRDLAWSADRVAEGAEDRVVEGEVDVAAFASVSIAEDADEALAAARPPVAFIAAGAAPPVLDRHDIDRERAERIGEKIEAGEFSEAFGLVTDAMLTAFCLAGDPESVAEQLAAVGEHVDSVVAGSPLGPDRENAVRLLGEAFDAAGV